MNLHAVILEHEIENFGLTKDGKAFAKSMLSQAWDVDYLIHINGLLNVLVLKNENGKDAIWYFDETKKFIGNSINNIKIHNDKKNFFFKIVFFKFINSIKQKNNKIYQSLSRKGYFFSELLLACDYLNSELTTNTKEVDPDVYEILFQDGRCMQDKCIASETADHHISVNLDGEIYTSSHGIVINISSLAYPLWSKSGDLCLIIEGGHRGAWYILFMEKTQKVYYTKQASLLFSGPFHPIKALINHLIDFGVQIENYMNQSSKPKKYGIVGGNAHIGHSLWNYVSAIQRISDKKIANNLNEIIVVNGENSEPWISVEEIIEDYNGIVNRKLNHKAVAEYVYQVNSFPIRLTDDYIKANSIEKIISKAKSRCSQITNRTNNELRVVLGLRVENRTWTNQADGLVQIAKFLAQRFENLTLIIDGHDLITTTGKVYRSALESNDHGVVEIEKKLVFNVQNALKETNVRVIDAVAMSLECSIAWIISSDFFIAPWGAGLAKYKWVANLPGVVFTSKLNMQYKGERYLYENPQIREDATSCIYVDELYLTDEEDTPSLVSVPGVKSGHSRANFYVDPKGIDIAIEKVLTQIGRA